MSPLPESTKRTVFFKFTTAEARRNYLYNYDVDPDEVRSMPISGTDSGTCFTILDSELGLPKSSIAGYNNAHLSQSFVEKSLRTTELKSGTVCVGSEIIYKTNQPNIFVKFWYPNSNGFSAIDQSKFTDRIAEYETVTVVKLGLNKLKEYQQALGL